MSSQALQSSVAGLSAVPAARSDAGDAIAAMEQYHGASSIDLVPASTAGVSVLAVPKGMEVLSVKKYHDEYLQKPERRKGTARLTDAASFIAHLLRFQSEDSVVFASPDRNKPSLTAVYDYHAEGPDGAKADWLQHRAVYEPALSDAWKAWSQHSGRQMPQVEFAEFIEEHLTDVIVPNLDDPNLKTFAELVQGRFAEPSELLALSRGLQVNVEAVVKNAITLNTGEISVQYEESHRDGSGQPISIPNLFQICIPVFYAGTQYRIAARLRYRRAQGSIHWSYLLVRPDLVFDDAFRGIVQKVEEETPADVFLGAPEA